MSFDDEYDYLGPVFETSPKIRDSKCIHVGSAIGYLPLGANYSWFVEGPLILMGLDDSPIAQAAINENLTLTVNTSFMVFLESTTRGWKGDKIARLYLPINTDRANVRIAYDVVAGPPPQTRRKQSRKTPGRPKARKSKK